MYTYINEAKSLPSTPDCMRILDVVHGHSASHHISRSKVLRAERLPGQR